MGNGEWGAGGQGDKRRELETSLSPCPQVLFPMPNAQS